MPKVKIQNNGEVIKVNPMISLLNNLLINYVPIETICGGKAICGKCVIRIIEGREFLSPVKEREKIRLNSLKIKDYEDKAVYRLACQTYTRRDIAIKILNYKG